MAASLAGKKNVTVTTNAINIAHELSSFDEEITIVVVGGILRKAELSLLGHIAELSLPGIGMIRLWDASSQHHRWIHYRSFRGDSHIRSLKTVVS
jgi:hypothetical protein